MGDDYALAQDSSHEVTLADHDPQLVVKRYLPNTHRAPQREWRALRLLQKHAPGLAPEPVRADLSADPPLVVMRRLAGEPMRGLPLTSSRLDALGVSLELLHNCVPQGTLARIEMTGSDDPSTARSKLRRRLAALSKPVDDEVIADAFDYASSWLESDEAIDLARFDGSPVFARADHNLANFLLDDDQVRLVDFEYAGRGDRPAEFAELIEHISARSTPDREWETFLSRCDLDPGERHRLADLRRMNAIWWLLVLMPGEPGHARNPPGTLHSQAERLLSL